MEKITVEMTQSKETPNTHKYDEVETPGSPKMLRNVYLPKWYMNGSTPKRIRVTVEAID